MTAIDPIQVIAKHWDSTPVPIDAIIAEIGLPLCYEPLDDNTSGYVERTDGTYKIVVNSNHARTRQRFTAAHELGHYIFHRDLLGEGVGDNRAYRTEGTKLANPNIRPLHERQANSFAANVLMPCHRLSSLANESTASLASMFDVSKETMRIRLGRQAHFPRRTGQAPSQFELAEHWNCLIITKPDPLVDAMAECGVDPFESWADKLRAALAKRGGRIVFDD